MEICIEKIGSKANIDSISALRKRFTLLCAFVLNNSLRFCLPAMEKCHCLAVNSQNTTRFNCIHPECTPAICIRQWALNKLHCQRNGHGKWNETRANCNTNWFVFGSQITWNEQNIATTTTAMLSWSLLFLLFAVYESFLRVKSKRQCNKN